MLTNYLIKKAGGSQAKHDIVKAVNNIATSKKIKPKKKTKRKK